MCDQMNSASFRSLFPFLESSLGSVQTYGRYFKNKSILRERKLNEPKFHTKYKMGKLTCLKLAFHASYTNGEFITCTYT
jgi:hypothetical protein